MSNNLKERQDHFVQRLTDVTKGQMSIIDATTYVDGNTPVDLICNICGTKKLHTKPTTYLGDCTKSKSEAYKMGCKTCRYKYYEEHHLIKFKSFMHNYYHDKYEISSFEYNRNNSKSVLSYNINLKCANCLNIFHITGPFRKDLHCPVCESNFMGERIIGSILTLNNIKFRPQVMCYPNYLDKSLRLDFLAEIKGNKYDIEYNGKQHYDDSINWYSGDRDENKQKYCKNEGIIYAPVPYTKVTIKSIFNYLNSEYGLGLTVVPDDDVALPFGYSVKLILLYLKDHTADETDAKFGMSYKTIHRFLLNLGFDTPTDWQRFMKQHRRVSEVRDELKYYVENDYSDALLTDDYKRKLMSANRSHYATDKYSLSPQDEDDIITKLKSGIESEEIYQQYNMNKNNLYGLVRAKGYKNITAVRRYKIDQFIADPDNQQKIMDYVVINGMIATVKHFNIKQHDISDILKDRGYSGITDYRDKMLADETKATLDQQQTQAFDLLKTHSSPEVGKLMGIDRHKIADWVHANGYDSVKDYQQKMNAERILAIRKFILPNKKSNSVAKAREKFHTGGRSEIEQAYKTLGYKTIADFRENYNPDEDPLLSV